MRIDWSPGSLDEIEEIGEYIGVDRPGASEAWIDGLVARVERLATFPRSGRLVAEEEGRSETREIIYTSYRVLYRVLEDHVEILAVIHTRRDTVDEG
jgi:toxin ParE1/3/4